PLPRRSDLRLHELLPGHPHPQPAHPERPPHGKRRLTARDRPSPARDRQGLPPPASRGRRPSVRDARPLAAALGPPPPSVVLAALGRARPSPRPTPPGLRAAARAAGEAAA